MSIREPGSIDLEGLLTTLTTFGVEFVVVGGLAVIAHGYERSTTDLDICYAQSQHNARVLLRALRHLNAQLLDADERPQPLPMDFRALQHGDVVTFVTDAGNLDCMTAPDGTRGFEDVAPGAMEVPFRGVVVRVASLNDLIRMKRASGEKLRRGKDRIGLEVLLQIREEQDTTGASA